MTLTWIEKRERVLLAEFGRLKRISDAYKNYLVLRQLRVESQVWSATKIRVAQRAYEAFDRYQNPRFAGDGWHRR